MRWDSSYRNESSRVVYYSTDREKRQIGTKKAEGVGINSNLGQSINGTKAEMGLGETDKIKAGNKQTTKSNLH